MLESKKGLTNKVKLLGIFSDVAKPLMARSRSDSQAKEALNALDAGRQMMESAIEYADMVFLEREEAAAKRQGSAPAGKASSGGRAGKTS